MTEPVSPAHGIERFSNEPLTAARGTESVKAAISFRVQLLRSDKYSLNSLLTYCVILSPRSFIG